MAPSGTRGALPPPAGGERVIQDGNQAVLLEQAPALALAQRGHPHSGQAGLGVQTQPERKSWTQPLPAGTRISFFYT